MTPDGHDHPTPAELRGRPRSGYARSHAPLEGPMPEPRELLHEIMLMAWNGTPHPGEVRALIAQWVMDCGEEWAGSRQGLPRTLRPGRVHLTVMYYPDGESGE